MSAKFRKKPIVIDAIQWVGGNIAEIWDAFGPGEIYGPTEENPDWLRITTLEGEMRANLGDWVIRGVKGELYPCKPDIFEATYEPVAYLEPEPCPTCNGRIRETVGMVCQTCGHDYAATGDPQESAAVAR